MSVIPILAGQGTIFLDAQAHKTIYDGCTYARGLGATVRRFRAGDVEHLAELLREAPAGQTRLVCMDGVNSMTGNAPDLIEFARVCRENDALLYVDDAHGFGVLGERTVDETSPYGARGNAIVKYCGETYDNIVLVGGFSKSYSSLLAFLALPTWLKNHLKVSAPPYLYSGPAPTASLATVLAGMDVNAKRGDAIRADLYRKSVKVLDHVRSLGGVHTEHRQHADHRAAPGGRPGHRPGRQEAVGPRHLRDPGGVPAGSPRPGGVPCPGDRGQHRRRDR